MEQYNNEIAGNSDVEFIHVSRDRDEKAAEDWAKKAKFPWLTINKEDADKLKLSEYKNNNFVPHYALVGSDGKVVANGKRECFDKVKELVETEE